MEDVTLSPFAVIPIRRLTERNLCIYPLTVRLRSPSLSKAEGRVNSAKNLGI
jgi:hypothetical protein